MPDFPLIDCHMHVFDRGEVSYEWIGQRWPELDRPHAMRDFDEARGVVAVEAVIFCELLPDAGHELDEVAYVEQRSREDGRIAAMTAAAPMHEGASIAAHVRALAEHPIVRGVRYHHPAAGLHSLESLVAAAKVLGRHGLHCEIGATQDGLTDAIAVAQACPDVPIVIVHMGMNRSAPDLPNGVIDSWRQQVRTLAALDNVVAVKISGTASVAGRAWTAEAVRPCLEHLVGTFGVNRCMYGSDWPASSFAHGYGDWVELIDAVMAEASQDERRALYRDTARRVFRLS